LPDYTVLAFTLSVTVMSLLTDLTDNKNIDIKYCQKIRDKYRLTHLDTVYE